MRKFAYLSSQNLKDMRKLFTFLAAVAALVSCNNVRHDFVNETYSENEDSLIIRCSNLRGLGPLVIGDTKISDVSHLNLNFLYKTETFFLSHWHSEDSELASALNNAQNIDCIQLHNLKIGEIEIGGDVDLAFYDGKLVAIAFNKRTLLDHYLTKYGNGIGYKYVNNFIYEDINKCKYHNKEEHLWYNETVQMSYKYIFSGTFGNLYSFEKIIMSDRTGKYDAFLKEIEKVKEQCVNAKEKRMAESLDML